MGADAGVLDPAEAAQLASRVAQVAQYSAFAVILIVDSAVAVAAEIRGKIERGEIDSDDGSDVDHVWIALRSTSFKRFCEVDIDDSGALDIAEMKQLVIWVMARSNWLSWPAPQVKWHALLL